MKINLKFLESIKEKLKIGFNDEEVNKIGVALFGRIEYVYKEFNKINDKKESQSPLSTDTVKNDIYCQVNDMINNMNENATSKLFRYFRIHFTTTQVDKILSPQYYNLTSSLKKRQDPKRNYIFLSSP